VRAAKLGDRGGVVKWLLATMLVGVLVDVQHVREWLRLVVVFTSPIQNASRVPYYGMHLCTVTRLHALPVTPAVVYVGAMLGRTSARRGQQTGLRVCMGVAAGAHGGRGGPGLPAPPDQGYARLADDPLDHQGVAHHLLFHAPSIREAQPGPDPDAGAGLRHRHD